MSRCERRRVRETAGAFDLSHGDQLIADVIAFTKKATDAAATAGAKKFMEYTYDPVLAGVASPAGVPAAELADMCGKFRKAEHEAIFGQPAYHVSVDLGMSSPAAEITGAVVTEFALPFDQQLRTARRTLCLVGMLAGALTQNVQVFGACLKLYVRDKAVDLVKSKVHEAVFGRQVSLRQ